MPLKLYRRGEVFWMRGTVAGRRVHESTKTSIKSLAEEIRIDREKQLVQRSLYGEKSSATFAEAVISYLETGGEARFLSSLNTHFGKRRLTSIDQAAIDRAALALYPSAAPATINRQLITPMGAVLNHAARRGLCDPVALERRREPKGRTRWLWPDEAKRFVESSAPHIKPLALFLLGTGCRAGEALSLEWRHVNLSGGEAWIWETKNGDPRRVEIPSAAVAALANLPHRTGRVFKTGVGKDYVMRDCGGGQVKFAFDAASERAKIERVTPHVFRHTWATWYYGATRDVMKLMTLGGWKKLDMVQRYVKLAPREIGPLLIEHGWLFNDEPLVERMKNEAQN